MESYVLNGRGKELIGFCKERFSREQIALMYENGNPEGPVFIRTQSPEVISVVKQRFSIEEGAPGINELYFWNWMKIGRVEWFENKVNLHFTNAT